MEQICSFNNIGLSLDAIGVVIIFIFGISSDLNRDGAVGLLVENSDEEAKKARKHDCISKIGLVLIIIGFILQIIGNLIG